MLALVVAAGTIFGADFASAQSAVRVRVSFTEARYGESRLEHSVNRVVEAHLLGGNRIVDIDQRRGASGRGPGRQQRSESEFRGEFRPVEGAGARAVWRVGANNTLVRTVRYRNDVETIVVSVTGPSCNAQVTYRLKPGARAYQRRRGSYTQVRAEGVSCSISE